MSEIVIADTSCLIVLDKIGRLELLPNLFTSITVNPEIQEEFGLALPKWIIVERVQDHKRQQLLELELDPGGQALLLGVFRRMTSNFFVKQQDL